MTSRPLGVEFLYAKGWRMGGQTDRHDGANNRFSQFRKRAKKKSIRMQVGHSPCNEMQNLAKVQTLALSSTHCYNPHTRPRASQPASPEMSEGPMSLATLHMYLPPQT